MLKMKSLWGPPCIRRVGGLEAPGDPRNPGDRVIRRVGGLEVYVIGMLEIKNIRVCF